MASAKEILRHSTTAPSPGEDEVGRVVELMSLSGPDVELTETLELRTSFYGPDVELAETQESGMVPRTLESRTSFASLPGPELELTGRLLAKNDFDTLSNDFITSISDLLGTTTVTGQVLGSFTSQSGPVCQVDPVISLSGEAPRVRISET